jgi:LPS-assembly lipoprotein
LTHNRRTFLSALGGITLLSFGGLSACGFRLRGSVTIPYKAILISGRPSPQLRYDLERIIVTGSNAKVVSNGKDADLI